MTARIHFGIFCVSVSCVEKKNENNARERTLGCFSVCEKLDVPHEGDNTWKVKCLASKRNFIWYCLSAA
jgi:hypothetical protein